MPEFKNKEEYERWKAQKAKSSAEKLQEQKTKNIEVVCGKCGNKNIYNPENKKEKCERCGEWLYQFVTTPVSISEKTRTVKSGLLSLLFCIIAACGAFIPILLVGNETTGYKYYIWDGFGENLIGLLFVFYGLILASIVFSLLNIYLT
jgi:ribosomal protein S27E